VMAAALVAAWLSTGVDVLTDPVTGRDFPRYFDRMYALRVSTEITYGLLLAVAVADDCWILGCLGRNFVGAYLTHLYISAELPFAVAAAGSGGPLAQLAVLVWVPMAFVLTFGAAAQKGLALLARAAGSAASSAARHCVSASARARFSTSRQSGAPTTGTWSAWGRWGTLRAARCDAGCFVCLDGGTGSEVERRVTQAGGGHAVHGEGWTCTQWKTHPRVLVDVHKGYLQCGAEVVIANSYATNRHVMAGAGLEELTEQATRESVRLAIQARTEYLAEGPRSRVDGAVEPIVAGSMSCHPPCMAHGTSMDAGIWPSPEVETAGYYEQAALLRDAGVDALFVEMVWDWKEHGQRAVRAADSVGLPVVVCLAVFDAASCGRGAPRLGCGTPVREVAGNLAGGSWRHVEAICVHHTKLPLVLDCLRSVRQGWKGPLGAYPDHGTFKMPHWEYDVLEAERFLQSAEQWASEVGCTLFGGCCGVGPEVIARVSVWCQEHNSRLRAGASGVGPEPRHCLAGSDECPILIVGAGVGGLAAAHECQKRGYAVVIIEKENAVGGCWHKFGNTTSKLQSHSATYVVDLERPHHLASYPSKAEFMAYMSAFAGNNRITEHILLRSELRQVKRTAEARYTATYSQDGQTKTFEACAVLAAPGRLRQPRRQRYKGEDEFAGEVGYGLADDLRGTSFQGKRVVILGHGSFAVENMRTSLEHGAPKVVMICRRRTLVLPRAASFAFDRCTGRRTLPVADALAFCQRAYDIVGLDCRQFLTTSGGDGRPALEQPPPPVSDLYFLSQHCGRLDVVVDSVRHFAERAVITMKGRCVAADVVFKCLGFEALDSKFDQSLALRSMTGFWVNGDPRCFVQQEPTGQLEFRKWPLPFNNPHYMYTYIFFHFLERPEAFADIARLLPTCRTCAYDNAHVEGTFAVAVRALRGSHEEKFREMVERASAPARGEPVLRHFLDEQRGEWLAYAGLLAAQAPRYPYAASDIEALEMQA